MVATAGLSEMVAATRFDGPDPLDAPTELPAHGEARTRRVVDLMRAGRRPSDMRFGITLDCRLRAAPAAPAAAAAGEALLVEERCRGDAAFTNRFWADPRTGSVFCSEQWIGEDVPPLVVEVVAN